MPHTLKTSALVGIVMLLAAPVMAQTVGVSPCNREAGGVFRPGLLTVEPDGTRTFHPVGQDGLTEDIVYNRSEAMTWIAGVGLFPAGTVFNNYAGFICGLPCEECDETAAPSQPEDPETEDPEVEPTE